MQERHLLAVSGRVLGLDLEKQKTLRFLRTDQCNGELCFPGS